MLGFALGGWAAGCGGAGAQSPRNGVSTLSAETARSAPSTGDGAYSLVLSIRRALTRAGERPWGETLVSLETLRNQSHASTGEFDAMRERLARVLSRAGSSGGIPMRFVVSPGEPVDYDLGGAAYLMTAGGFDQWELYLSLRVAESGPTLWSADGPVRMLRQPRGADELYLP